VPLEDVARGIVRELFASVEPFDEVERGQQADALGWIDAGHPLFRVNPPVDPPKHLAVYFAVLDDSDRTLMLVDHRKAQAQLLPGGHVDPDEDPRFTVVREADEELRLTAKFHDVTGDAPLFLSVTTTRGAHSHTDVTLWFVLTASRSERIEPDPGEFAGVHWLSLDSTDWHSDHFDPHMARFAAKLRKALDH
jgi:8-oxo-dGTP diphosphatase